MAFLNLGLAEFLAIFLPLAASVVALYLYDRSRRRQLVSTLRFFRQAAPSPVVVRRKRIHQPWSLLLQLVSLALLLLAIAEPRLGRPGETARDHVLILEASAWMNSAATADGRISLMQVARQRALDYLRAVPSQDRVMLVRADQLATPITPFTRNRRDLETAIRNCQPGATALNLSGSLELARSAQRLSPNRPGEIAMVGSGRVPPSDLEQIAAGGVSNLRAILLGGEPGNCGIRKLSARRIPADPLQWEIDVGGYNYGSVERRTALGLFFGGVRVGGRTLPLAPHSAAEAAFHVRATQAGALEAVLDSKDEYRADNRAAIQLPALEPLKVQVFTTTPALWRPLLEASRFLEAQFLRPGDYAASGPPQRLVILDNFTPSVMPDADAVWIAPPGARVREKIHVRRWDPTHPVAAGLHNKDLAVAKATILDRAAADVVVAESEAGPVLVASEDANHKKRVAFGFHPLEKGMGNHLAVPLLFANIVRWLSPDLFRLTEISARFPGLVELETRPGTRREQIQVTSSQERDLPFTLLKNRLRFYAGGTGTVRVSLPEQELIYSLNIPEVGEVRWSPPAGVRRGVPPPAPAPASRDLWPWLALAGAMGLLAEWVLFGRQPRVAPVAGRREFNSSGVAAAETSPLPLEVRS